MSRRDRRRWEQTTVPSERCAINLRNNTETKSTSISSRHASGMFPPFFVCSMHALIRSFLATYAYRRRWKLVRNEQARLLTGSSRQLPTRLSEPLTYHSRGPVVPVTVVSDAGRRPPRLDTQRKCSTHQTVLHRHRCVGHLSQLGGI